jgi:Arc/MetJ family transcription regulator
MRTNIVIDPDLLGEARKYSSATTKRGIVEDALRAFIETRAAERRAATWRERVLALDRKLARVTLRQSPHEILRADRDRA